MSYPVDCCRKPAVSNLLKSNPKLGSYIQKDNWNLSKSPSDCSPDSELGVSLFQRLATLSSEHGTTHRIRIDTRRQQAQYLLHVLDHAPGIISCITSIRWGCENRSRQWEENAAQTLAFRLLSINDLTLAQWGSCPFVPTLPFQAVGDLFRSTSITTLNIENLVFTHGSQFVHFVHAFTALRHLSYRTMNWEEIMPNILSKGSPKAPPLRSITLGRSGQPAIPAGVVQWLIDQTITPRLATIVARQNVPSEMKQLVQRCASSLVDMTCSSEPVITVHPHYLIFITFAARHLSLDLSNCNVLTRLDIVVMDLHCVLKILHTIQHHSLRSLGVGCYWKDYNDWEALCVVLNRPCFSSLDTLTVSYYTKDRGLAANARQRLAPLSSKAAYRFINHEWSWED
jgi:hypothetical protein